jgi:two-component system sensor histidine kinase KdpD
VTDAQSSPQVVSPSGQRPARGRLRIYLGAAPGVGKTYAMLSEAQRRAARGTDVVIGIVETHRRPQTEAMIAGLEVVPRRPLEHRGSRFDEMDLDAVLARRPEVALVDELAHTNVPGARNTKRWQDVHELLAHGIDVVSTVNIQHLESLNDVVEAITGVRQRETVPDAVVRAADQIELVDMSPESLRRRLAHGNVYTPEKVDAALGNYFRIGNLTALRELALLWVADRVEEGLERYREEHGIQGTWAARARIVVALTGSPHDDALLRRGALIAGRSAGRALTAVHVVRGDGTRGARPEALAALRQLTEDLGGTFHVVVGDDVGAGVLDFARSVNGTQVVVGTSRRGRLSTALRPSTADLIVRDSGDIDVHVVTRTSTAPDERGTRRPVRGSGSALPWVLAVVLPAVLTALLLPFRDALSLSTVLLAFLLGVVATSLVGGLIPAVLTAVEASLLANFYFVPPVGTFTIAEPENAFAIVVFIAVGAVVASIVDRSAARASEAARRGAEANVLASLSAGVLRRKDGVRALLDQARETFGMRSAALFELSPDRGTPTTIEVSGEQPPTSPERADVTVDAGPSLVLALSGAPLPAADRRILDAFAAQTAAVLERDRLAAKAADAARLRESESVRTALLTAVSHDLRTPLAGIKASITTLQDDALNLSDNDRRALLSDAARSADSLDALVANLLDLSRIQTGSVRPRLEPTSLDEVLQRALHGIDPAMVSDDTDDATPLILTDAGLLERSIANLVENAVRYTPPGGRVRLCAARVPDDRLQLRIVDTGPGVAGSDRDRMFEPFQRLGDVPSGAGVGLGLAVARGLAEAVGAALDAEDTPGGGLTMVLTIPLAEAEEHGGGSTQPHDVTEPR